MKSVSHQYSILKIPKLDDPIEVTTYRARRLWWLMWAGVIWSFIYTALSLAMMFDLSNQLQDTCVSRQMGRTAIRAALISDPDFDAADFETLNLHLPPKVKC